VAVEVVLHDLRGRVFERPDARAIGGMMRNCVFDAGENGH
jgi:hypothetical protein